MSWERGFSSAAARGTATFLDVDTNPYVVLTLRLFREQLSMARAAGDGDRAATLEAAIRSLLESTSGFLGEPAPKAAWS